MLYSSILNTSVKAVMTWDIGCILEMQTSLLSRHVQNHCMLNVEHICLEHMKIYAVESWYNLVLVVQWFNYYVDLLMFTTLLISR